MIVRDMRYAKINFEMREHTIYRLLDPFTEKVRYVGRTSLHLWYERLDAHVEDALGKDLPSSRLYCWIIALDRKGAVPIIEDVEVVASADAVAREAHWIEHHRAAGDSLLNVSCREGTTAAPAPPRLCRAS